MDRDDASNTALDSAVDAMLGEDTIDAPDETTQGTAPEAQPQPETANTEAAVTDKPSTSDAGAAPDNQPAGAGRAKPQIYPHHLPADKHGNLIDDTGRIVARAGNERAYYEAARNAMLQLQRVDEEFGNDIARLETELQAYKSVATAPEKLGITPQQAFAAMEWGALYASRPEEAAKMLLADLAAKGIRIDGMQLDTAALAKLIDDKIKPFADDRQSAAKQAEADAYATKQWKTLTAEFTWLPQYEADFAKLLARAPNDMTEREVALRMDNYMLRNRIGPYADQQPEPQRTNRAAAPAMTNTGDMTPTTQTTETLPQDTRGRIRELLRRSNFKLRS